MEIVQVVSVALTTGAAAIEQEQASRAVTDAVWSLRHALARQLGVDPVGENALPEAWQEQLRARLPSLPGRDLRELVVHAQIVLAETDPQGTAAGRYMADGEGVDVHVVRRRATARRPVDAVQQLARVGEPRPTDGGAPADSERITLVLSQRSPEHTAAVISVAQQMLIDCERELGPEHPAALTTRMNLAHLYRSVGRTEEAIEAMERVVTGRRRALGAAHPDTRAAETTLNGWRAG